MKLANIVQAHKSTISCISMNSEGTLLATASEKVRVSLGSASLFNSHKCIGIRVQSFVSLQFPAQTKCISFEEVLTLPRSIPCLSI